MTVAWIGVGAAVLGAGASYAGSKKQADASKKGSNQQFDMFNRLNAQQQPYIQSGYGAMGRLNTLLGLGGGVPRGVGSSAPSAMTPTMTNTMYRPTPGGGVKQIAAVGPGYRVGSSPKTNPRLAQLLALRAQNGDTEAARILGGV